MKYLSEHKKRYLKYINSDEWVKIRVDLITIYGVCQECGSDNRLQVHHITYDNLFFEEPEDLLLLCASCHLEKHPEIIKKEIIYKRPKKSKQKNKRQNIRDCRRIFFKKVGKKLKGCHGWIGLAKAVAPFHGKKWVSGTKKQARLYVIKILKDNTT